MLGSGAVIPFNTERDPVQMLMTLTRFYAHESCGQCTPCREGHRLRRSRACAVIADKRRQRWRHRLLA